eukprot:269449-Pyramimonas_sp.AAC.1
MDKSKELSSISTLLEQSSVLGFCYPHQGASKDFPPLPPSTTNYGYKTGKHRKVRPKYSGSPTSYRGFLVVDHNRVKLGHGSAAYERAKKLVKKWEYVHNQTGWRACAIGAQVRTSSIDCPMLVPAHQEPYTLGPLKLSSRSLQALPARVGTVCTLYNRSARALTCVRLVLAPSYRLSGNTVCLAGVRHCASGVSLDPPSAASSVCCIAPLSPHDPIRHVGRLVDRIAWRSSAAQICRRPGKGQRQGQESADCVASGQDLQRAIHVRARVPERSHAGAPCVLIVVNTVSGARPHMQRPAI